MNSKAIIHPHCSSCEARNKSVFCDLNKADIDVLDVAKSCGAYKKGQTIFNEGTRPQGIFCVNSGKIKVFKTGDDGKEQILRLEKEGSILGYRSLLCGDTYSATGTAIEESKICFIPKSTFLSILDCNSALAFQMMKLLSHDLRNAEERITTLAQKPVRERLAEVLLFVKETYGLEADGATMSVILTREELANIVGTATETLIRLLADFKHENLIELEGKKIRLLDQKALLNLANIHD